MKYLRKIYYLIVLLVFQLGIFSCFNAQTVQLLSPNGGESLIGGSTHTISWNFSNINNLLIEYSLDGGLNWNTIEPSYGASNYSYDWLVPSVGTIQGMVRVTSILYFVQDESDGFFTIPTPTINLLYPNGGELFPINSGQYISWDPLGITNVILDYTTDNGLSWNNIGNYSAYDTYVNWQIPSTLSSQVKVRAYNEEDISNIDQSNSTFNIVNTFNNNLAKYYGGSFDGYTMSSSIPDDITITYPNGGEQFYPYQQIDIAWNYNNLDNIKLEYSSDNGQTWVEIVASINASTGSYTWIAPNIQSSQFIIKATALDRAISDQSDQNFTINQSFIAVTYPNGAESFKENTGQYIEWDFSGVSTVKVQYSTDNGSNWTEIGIVNALDRYINWDIPSVISSQCLIKISDNDVPLKQDVSNNTFNIVNTLVGNLAKYYGGSFDGYSSANSIPKSLDLTYPVGGENLQANSQYNITWDYNNVDNISIEYSIDDGLTWVLLTSNIPTTHQSYLWTTPTTPSYLCRVRIKEVNGTFVDISDQNFTINNSWVEVTYPNGGESFSTQSGQYIEWDYSFLQNITLEYSVDNGFNWLTIGTFPAEDRYANWTVPPTPSSQLLIRATNTDNLIHSDISNFNFSSFSKKTSNLGKFYGGSFDGYSMYDFKDVYINVIVPNGGEYWGNGTQQEIKWTTLNTTLDVKIEYSTDNELTWNLIATNIPYSQGSYNWFINSNISSTCKVRISEIGGIHFDKSDNFFTIAGTNGIATAPLSSASFCSLDSSTVNYSLSSNFDSTNKFIVQLSDSIGSFSGSVQNIGEINSTISQNIDIVFPEKNYTSSLYRLRVISTSPPIIGSDNGANFTIIGLPNVQLGNDTVICSGDSVSLNVSNSLSSYLWNTGDTTPVLSALTGQTYDVAVTNSCGTSYDTIIINEITPPYVSLGPDTLICINNLVTLDAQNIGSSYLWSTGATSQTINLISPGIYGLSVTNQCGTSSDQIDVSVLPPLTIDLGQDTTLCNGQNITLSAGNNGLSYTWSNGTDSNLLFVNTPGTYYVSVSDQCNIYSDQIIVNDGTFSVNAGQDIVISPGDSVTLTASGGNYYNWNNGQQTASIIVSPNVTSSYNVISTNIFNCTSYDSVLVIINSDPIFTSTADTTASLATLYSYILQASDPDGDALSFSGTTIPGWLNLIDNANNTATLSGTPTNTGVYSVSIIVDDGNGGNAIQSFDITVIFSCLPINYTDTIYSCDSIIWIDGNKYISDNNTATYTLTNAAGCDSVVTLDLTINNSNTGIDSQTACDSLTWIDGVTYIASNNTANYTLTNAVGCDSVVTLDLIINYSNSETDTQTACDSLTWIDGVTYTSSNTTATYTLTNVVGCDSVVTLDLTINYSTTGTDLITACDSLTWIDGVTYTSSNNTATYTLTSAAGCDSVVTLDLTIINSSSGIDTQTACDSYTWIDGVTYTASNNTATHTLTNAAGCDSVVTLDLTINNSSSLTDVQTACDSLTWIDGITYTASNNTATYTLTNGVGCDSVVTLDLTIYEFLTDFSESSSLFTGPPFVVQFTNNTPNLTNYNFTWDFGDSTIEQNNNASVFHEYMYNGLYDVTLIAEDITNGCGFDTLKKEDLIYCAGGPNLSIIEFSNNINVFPNPTNENITISVNNFNGNIQTEVYDLIGHRLKTTNETTISLRDYARGIYLLKVSYGDRVEEVKVIKH